MVAVFCVCVRAWYALPRMSVAAIATLLLPSFLLPRSRTVAAQDKLHLLSPHVSIDASESSLHASSSDEVPHDDSGRVSDLGPPRGLRGQWALLTSHTRALLLTPQHRSSFLTSCGCAVAQNLMFSNAVLYYGRRFVEAAGIAGAARATYGPFVVG